MKEKYEDIVREWYNDMRPLFTNVIKSKYRMLSYDAIEDIYQDAFIAIYTNLHNGRVKENTAWKSYIIQIGSNMASKRLRKDVKICSIDSEKGVDNDSTISELLEEMEPYSYNSYNNILDILGTELKSIPTLCNTILKLFYYDRLSMDDIAMATNLKNSTTVKSKKYQCMKELKRRINKKIQH